MRKRSIAGIVFDFLSFKYDAGVVDNELMIDRPAPRSATS